MQCNLYNLDRLLVFWRPYADFVLPLEPNNSIIRRHYEKPRLSISIVVFQYKTLQLVALKRDLPNPASDNLTKPIHFGRQSQLLH